MNGNLSYDPLNTYAILIGISEYLDSNNFKSIPAARNNVESLKRIFSDAEFSGLPKENILCLIDKDKTSIDKGVYEMSQKANGGLILYYTGHGIRDRGKLFLAASNTYRNSVHIDGVKFEDIKGSLELSPSRSKIIILDCCYSGLAASDFMGIKNEVIEDRFKEAIDYPTGTFILTSSPANRISKFKENESYTEFTMSFIEKIDKGILNNQKGLDLETIYENLLEEYKKRIERQEEIYLPTRINHLDSPTYFIVSNKQYLIFKKQIEQARIKFERGEYEESFIINQEYISQFMDEQLSIENRKRYDFCKYFLAYEDKLREAKYKEAIENLTKAWELDLGEIHNNNAKRGIDRIKADWTNILKIKAKKAFGEHNYNFAKVNYEQLLKLHPNNIEFKEKIEISSREGIKQELIQEANYKYYTDKNYREAKKIYQRVTENFPNNLDALNGISNCNIKLIEEAEIFWSIAESLKLYSLYELYTIQYPNGQRITDAKERLNRIIDGLNENTANRRDESILLEEQIRVRTQQYISEIERLKQEIIRLNEEVRRNNDSVSITDNCVTNESVIQHLRINNSYTEQKAWRLASEKNTIQDYKKYLKDFANGDHLPNTIIEIRKLLDKLEFPHIKRNEIYKEICIILKIEKTKIINFLNSRGYEE